MKNTLNEFVNKLLDDIHNIDPELSLKRQTEYNQNFSNKVLNEQSSITAVSQQRGQLPTDPVQLAEYLHDNYELIAKKIEWNTQENCKVSFKELPEKNKTTMILLAGKIILDFGGNCG